MKEFMFGIKELPVEGNVPSETSMTWNLYADVTERQTICQKRNLWSTSA